MSQKSVKGIIHSLVGSIACTTLLLWFFGKLAVSNTIVVAIATIYLCFFFVLFYSIQTFVKKKDKESIIYGTLAVSVMVFSTSMLMRESLKMIIPEGVLITACLISLGYPLFLLANLERLKKIK